MKKVTIELFSLEDLDKETQNKVLEEHGEFLVEVYDNELYDSSFNMTRSKYAKQLTKSDIK